MTPTVEEHFPDSYAKCWPGSRRTQLASTTSTTSTGFSGLMVLSARTSGLRSRGDHLMDDAHARRGVGGASGRPRELTSTAPARFSPPGSRRRGPSLVRSAENEPKPSHLR
jgi:hypothetical protein